MKTIRFIAALSAAVTFVGAAGAALAHTAAGLAGHYQWRAAPQYGPRTPLKAPQRVFVADGATEARSDCPMMDHEGADADACNAMMGGRAG